MYGYFSLKSASASLYRAARSSLPHHVKFRVTGDVSGPVELAVGSLSPESPEEQAVRARAATAATAAVFQMIRFIVVEPPCSKV